MDLGLYNLKYPVRRVLRGLRPWLGGVNPNHVSWSMIPVGMATAWVYYLAATGPAYWFAVGVGLILLRMFLGTIDGLIAVEFNRATPRGELLNRLAPEMCDIVLLGALAAARPQWLWLGLAAVGVAWLTTFAGLLGAILGKPTQSVGPVGQTDRLAALLLISALALPAWVWNWRVDLIAIFLGWCVAGGVVTVWLRLRRTWRLAGGGGHGHDQQP